MTASIALLKARGHVAVTEMKQFEPQVIISEDDVQRLRSAKQLAEHALEQLDQYLREPQRTTEKQRYACFGFPAADQVFVRLFCPGRSCSNPCGVAAPVRPEHHSMTERSYATAVW